MEAWTAAMVPDLTGKVMLVTGANSGLGLETAKVLAARGARVVLACRDLARAEAAATEVRRESPSARLELRRLDLGSLASVQAFAREVRAAHPVLDVLVNNAGVMAVSRKLTQDRFELHLGINHLGHFALTLALLPSLEQAEQGRVVTVSSLTHKRARLNFEDLMSERRYSPWAAYGQSKLANLMFTFELERKLRSQGKRTLAAAAHPGYAATNLQAVQPGNGSGRAGALVMRVGNVVLAQRAAQGALPTLYAATAADVKGGDYFGPAGPLELRGPPKRVEASARAHDEDAARHLWDVSVQHTGAEWFG